MKPSKFSLLFPDSLHEALEMLENADSTKVLAGGQSLMPILNLRIAYVDRLISLERVGELRGTRLTDGEVVLGALTTHQEALDLGDHVGLHAWSEALSVVGHQSIRNRGTVAGSLAHADPSAEWPALGLLLDARCTIVCLGGEREERLEDLISGIFTTTLEPNEIVTEVVFEQPTGQSGSSFLEFARRPGDFALAGAATLLSVDEPGANCITTARVVVFGVEGCARRVWTAESALAGKEPTAALFREVAEMASEELEPIGNSETESAFKKAIARELIRRSLLQSWHRAGGEDLP